MSRLDELIAELCPNGVEYKTLGSCTQNVENIKWSSTSSDYMYIDLSSVSIDTHKITNTTKINKDDAPSRAQQIVNNGDILFGTTRPLLKRYCQIEKHYPNQICSTGFCVLRPNEKIVNKRWIYHIISSSDFMDYVEKHQQGASYPSISDSNVKKYKIPVPPLPIQEEIVRILDKFAELEAELETELEAELKARRKQYFYYLNEILNKRTTKYASHFQKKKLGQCCEIRCGWVFPAQFQGKKDCELPFYKVSDMNTDENYVYMQKANNYISPSEAKLLKCKPVPQNTIIFPKIGAAIGTNKKRITKTLSCYDNNIVGLIPGNEIYYKYLYHLFEEIDLMSFADFSGALPSIRKSTLEQFEIFIPPIDEQKRIVDILDKFDVISRSLKTGIPAEIAARRKQYEYYRDKLLTFKEKSA